MLFDAGLKGEMGEFGDYFKTWNWELGFRYSRDEAINLSESVVSAPGLREALLDTNPATAFNPFLNFSGVQQQTAIARSRVYVTLHDTAEFETPSAYFNLNGDLFQLPAGPVSFAVGAEYRGERFRDDPDSLNTTFNTIGATDLEASKVNRDVWGFYQEVTNSGDQPNVEFPGRIQPGIRSCRARGMVLAEYRCDLSRTLRAIAVRHPETEVLGSLATD